MRYNPVAKRDQEPGRTEQFFLSKIIALMYFNISPAKNISPPWKLFAPPPLVPRGPDATFETKMDWIS